MLKTFGSHVRRNVVGYIALFVALGGTTYAATGGNFILGNANSASSTTSLSAPITGKALQLTNTSTGAGATALGLNVASGHPPFTVNSGTKVANLNAANGANKIGTATPTDNIERTILSLGHLTITARCRQPSDTFLTLLFKSSVPATLNWGFAQGTDPNTTAVANGAQISSTQNQGFDLQGGGTGSLERLEGQFIYDDASGVTTVNLHAVATNAFNSCQVDGTAVRATV